MSVGLPGTGVGALFYLLSALWAPIHRLMKRDDRRSRGIAVAAIALGIVAVVAASTIALHIVLPEQRLQAITIDTSVGGEESDLGSLGLILVLSPLGTLGLILIGVRIGAALVARNGRGDAIETESDALVNGIDDALLGEQLEVAS
jgi:hypothetical protein